MQRISMKIENDSEKLSDVGLHLNELRDTFYSSTKRGNGNVFQVCLNSDGLLLQHDNSIGPHKNHLVKICDIIGGRCVWIHKTNGFGAASACGACSPRITEKQKNRRNEIEDAYLYVFAYILKKNLRNIRRERTVITLRFRSFDSHEDNMREAEKWYKALKLHRTNFILHSGLQGAELHSKPCNVIETKRLLVLLNPKSGSGKARDIFNQQVIPILNEAEIAYDLHVTKHSHYAFDFVCQKNLSVWNGIVAIGGDGLFHEILNGLLNRKDWNRTIKNISLGIVPCGSGNGLARSIAHCFQEPYEPKPIIGATLTVVGGHSALMDVVEIELQNKVIYSFLSVGWGLISDIDIESERLRPLGYQRFTIWTLHRLINLRTYRGRISFLPKKKKFENSTEIDKPLLEHRVSCNIFPPAFEIMNHMVPNDNSEFEDILSLETLANQSLRSRCDSMLSSGSRISTYYSITESIYHSVSGNSDCNESYMDEIYDNESNKHTQVSQLCVNSSSNLHEPIPNTWSVEDGEFVMIHAVYQTHLGSDCYFSPHSKLNDGTIYLVMIRSGISRSELLHFLINMSSGTHLPSKNSDFIRVEKVVAFRLEPHENSGILTIDGERVECGSLQARIFPSTVNIMVPNKDVF